MEEYYRTVEDVVGKNPVLLDYWDHMPDAVKRMMLESDTTVSTLGELQLMANQLRHQMDPPPKVF